MAPRRTLGSMKGRLTWIAERRAGVVATIALSALILGPGSVRADLVESSSTGNRLYVLL